MKVNDLPMARNEEARQDQAQCPKCGAFSGNDWSQCEGACPLSISPHYRIAVSDEFAGRLYEGEPR